jgi:hypothetical protein
MRTFICVTISSTFEIQADETLIVNYGVIFNADKKIVAFVPHEKLISFAEKEKYKRA